MGYSLKIAKPALTTIHVYKERIGERVVEQKFFIDKEDYRNQVRINLYGLNMEFT
ncbi:MAG TPA: hypothetical protein GXZ36_05705 [Firmicutes bacterium]|nr:hypothetical protein [Bacillota bacterium]